MRYWPSLTLPAVAAAALLSASAAASGLVAERIDVRGPILDPLAEFWHDVEPMTVPLLPQNMAIPFHLEPAVSEIHVRAVHNGAWIGVQLEWRDETLDWVFTTDTYGDQVAIQFPVETDPVPAPMMGHPGGAVNILQWRAAFQRDLEAGPLDILDLYPHALIDLYPDQVMALVDTLAYAGAIGVDNPVARPDASPVLDMVAMGWGTTTVKAKQHGDGHGVWRDGVWHVVITSPLERLADWDPDLVPGGSSMIAFAVWDGSADEVGGRKSWAPWVPMQLAE